MQTTAVHEERSETRKGFVMIVSFTLVGLGILIAAQLLDWGFWSWMAGGFALLIAGLATHGHLKMGGAGVVTCPGCSNTHKIKGVRAQRYVCCGQCGLWSHGSRSMSAVPEDHVAREPVFETTVPESSTWPSSCPVCGIPATATVAIEGTSALGDAAAALSPVSVQKVVTVEVPCCNAHKDGVHILLDGTEVRGSFRSFRYWRAFMAANEVGPTPGPLVWPPNHDRE